MNQFIILTSSQIESHHLNYIWRGENDFIHLKCCFYHFTRLFVPECGTEQPLFYAVHVCYTPLSYALPFSKLKSCSCKEDFTYFDHFLALLWIWFWDRRARTHRVNRLLLFSKLFPSSAQFAFSEFRCWLQKCISSSTPCN